MTYSQLITNLTTWLSGTTISSSSKNVFIKHSLTDEIELSELDYNYDFRIYITPMPIEIIDQNRIKYSVQIYIVSDIGLSPMIPDTGTVSKRFVEYSKCLEFFEAFIQQIPDDHPGIEFPITGNPIQIWDSKVDGLYFDFSLTTGLNCI